MALVNSFYSKITILTKLFAAVTLFTLAACGSLDNSDLAGDADNKDLVGSKRVSEVDFDDNENLKSCILNTGAEYVFELMALDCSYSDPAIDDLTGLESFTALRELSLNNNDIKGIEELSSLTKLEELYLHNNPQLSDLSPIAQLKSLNVLYIDDTAITTLEHLRNLTNLNFLGAANNIGLNDLKWLESMINLQYLDLHGNGDISDGDISSLANLTTNLNYLKLGNNNIYDVSYLKELTALRFLSLEDNFISKSCDLENLTNLFGLHLSNNRINDNVYCLRFLTKIEDSNGKRLILEDNIDIDCDYVDKLEEALEEDVTNDNKVIKPLQCN